MVKGQDRTETSRLKIWQTRYVRAEAAPLRFGGRISTKTRGTYKEISRERHSQGPRILAVNETNHRNVWNAVPISCFRKPDSVGPRAFGRSHHRIRSCFTFSMSSAFVSIIYKTKATQNNEIKKSLYFVAVSEAEAAMILLSWQV